MATTGRSGAGGKKGRQAPGLTREEQVQQAKLGSAINTAQAKLGQAKARRDKQAEDTAKRELDHATAELKQFMERLGKRLKGGVDSDT